MLVVGRVLVVFLPSLYHPLGRYLRLSGSFAAVTGVAILLPEATVARVCFWVVMFLPFVRLGSLRSECFPVGWLVSRALVIFPSVLLMSRPFNLFARDWIQAFADWLTFSIVRLLIKFSSRSRMLFILFSAVSGFCVLKHVVVEQSQVRWWLCRWVVRFGVPS